MTDRHADLAELLHVLRCPRWPRCLPTGACAPAKDKLTHEAFLYQLMQAELKAVRSGAPSGFAAPRACRRRRRFATLKLALRRASARPDRAAEDGAFLDEAINVVAVGRPGCGKRIWPAPSSTRSSSKAGRLLCSACQLVQELLAAKRDLRLPKAMDKLARFDCLILDDIGYVQQDRDEMEVLFTLLAERCERASVIITTNLVFSEWNRIFKDPMTTMAAIDRVVHHPGDPGPDASGQLPRRGRLQTSRRRGRATEYAAAAGCLRGGKSN
ncbi:MAG: ATP-binding protein [Gammaproteobacteria bacterium]